MKRLPPTPIAYNLDAYPTEYAAVLTAVRALGCTCDPDIAPSHHGRVKVHHDPHCALLDTGAPSLAVRCRNARTRESRSRSTS